MLQNVCKHGRLLIIQQLDDIHAVHAFLEMPIHRLEIGTVKQPGQVLPQKQFVRAGRRAYGVHHIPFFPRPRRIHKVERGRVPHD